MKDLRASATELREEILDAITEPFQSVIDFTVETNTSVKVHFTAKIRHNCLLLQPSGETCKVYACSFNSDITEVDLRDPDTSLEFLLQIHDNMKSYRNDDNEELND